MASSAVQIVLARVEDDIVASNEWTTARGDGINPVPKLRIVKAARAAMWLRAGTADDVKKARVFAADSGFLVFTYPQTEKDPLGKAKQDALAKAARLVHFKCSSCGALTTGENHVCL